MPELLFLLRDNFQHVNTPTRRYSDSDAAPLDMGIVLYPYVYGIDKLTINEYSLLNMYLTAARIPAIPWDRICRTQLALTSILCSIGH